MNWKELNDFSQLLKWVENKHRKERETLPEHNIDRYLYDAAVRRFRPIGELEIPRLFPSSTRIASNLAEENVFILLRQVERGVRLQPALTFQTVRLANGHFKASVYVVFVFRRSGASGEGVLHLGFRFESPEGPGEGNHDFFHVQMTKSVCRNGVCINEATSDLAHVPEVQPSFVLGAHCLVTFGLNLLVSLYGQRILSEVAEGVSPSTLKKFKDCFFTYKDSCVRSAFEEHSSTTRRTKKK